MDKNNYVTTVSNNSKASRFKQKQTKGFFAQGLEIELFDGEESSKNQFDQLYVEDVDDQ